MWRIAARLKYTKFPYSFKIMRHQIFLDMTLFLDISFSFHQIRLKHGRQLDYEVMQRILFQGYSTKNFIVIAL